MAARSDPWKPPVKKCITITFELCVDFVAVAGSWAGCAAASRHLSVAVRLSQTRTTQVSLSPASNHKNVPKHLLRLAQGRTGRD